MRAYVYILPLRDKGIFKIGKANLLRPRIKTLTKEWGEFDLSKSFVIECNKEDVYSIEKILHKLLKNNKVDLEKADGYTEFFNISSLEKILSKGFEIILSFYEDIRLYPISAAFIIEDYADKRKLVYKTLNFKWKEIGFVNGSFKNSSLAFNIFLYIMYNVVENDFNEKIFYMSMSEIENFAKFRMRLYADKKEEVELIEKLILNPLSISGEILDFAKIKFEDENVNSFSVEILDMDELKIFKDIFTKDFIIKNINIKGNYAKKFHFFVELIKLSNKKIETIDLNEFCHIINADHYKNNFNALSKRVINPAIKALNEIGFNIKIEFLKKGKKYTKLKIYFLD